MKSITTLLNQLTKGGVWEWKSLGEIATDICIGVGAIKSQIGQGNYPCVHYGEIYTKFEIWFDKCISKTDEKLIKEVKYGNYGDLLIANASTAKTGIGKCCAYLSQEKIIIGKNITLIRHNQNGKYLSYALATTKSINQKEKFAVTGTVTGITIASIKKLKIPLPPLEIQEQISEILDVLRELVRELETELKLRKKQYRYYLNKLISDVIEKGWGEYKTLGEIAIEIYRGNGITKSQVGSGKCPCILYGEIHTKHNIWFNKCSSLIDEKLIKRPKYCEYGDLIIAITSENLKDIGKTCAYLGQEKIIVGGDIVILKHKQNSKYLAYVLESYIGQKQKINLAQGMTVFHISTIAIKKLKIPLPPLEIQEQIANALDHLREICEDLEKGIPKEIELANKRYEYYRDLLITGEN